MSALFSDGGEADALYRWRLDRDVQSEGIVAALCGVNPSTAGVDANDQTIRKDIGFARLHGWRRIIKVNKFAFRATDVKMLASALDPIGSECDDHLRQAFTDADVIVPCWGPLSKLPKLLRRRYIEVRRLIERSGKPVLCFGTVLDGQPRHTCMIPYSTPLIPWERPA